MQVVCKENNNCDFVKTCVHSGIHEYNQECSYKNARCPEGCVCKEEYIILYERKTKLKILNEKSIL